MDTFRGVPVSSGVDYLTCTFKRNSLPERLQVVLDDLVHSQYGLGHKIKPWGFCGYSGWCCGGVQCGNRPDGWCVRLSSHCARENWFDFYQDADNVTRIDCQVTVQFPDDPSVIVAKHEAEVKRFHRKHHPKWKFRWIGNSDGSRTLYVGSRSSKQFMRIYDKQRESGMPEYLGCVRYEMQFNGDASSQVAWSMLGKHTAQDMCAGYCSQFLVTHGISQQFPTTTRPHVCDSAIPKNTDKSLRWLTAQVRPTVQHLVGLGMGQQVIAALGLQSQVIDYWMPGQNENEYLN